MLKKDIDQFWVEVFSPLFMQQCEDPLIIPGLLIDPVTSQSIKDIGQCYDPSEDMDLLSF